MTPPLCPKCVADSWEVAEIARQNSARKAYYPPAHNVRHSPGYFARLAYERKQPDRTTLSFRMFSSISSRTLAASSDGGLTIALNAREP